MANIFIHSKRPCLVNLAEHSFVYGQLKFGLQNWSSWERRSREEGGKDGGQGVKWGMEFEGRKGGIGHGSQRGGN